MHCTRGVCQGLSDPAEYAGGALHFQELRARIKLAARGAVAFRSGVSHGVRPVTSGNRLVSSCLMWNRGGISASRCPSDNPS
jgi:predicted 2-oxoglutarate/Fe(II)-dependent dioxygenase YbiX